jgi:hypothetical protein
MFNLIVFFQLLWCHRRPLKCKWCEVWFGVRDHVSSSLERVQRQAAFAPSTTLEHMDKYRIGIHHDLPGGTKSEYESTTIASENHVCFFIPDPTFWVSVNIGLMPAAAFPTEHCPDLLILIAQRSKTWKATMHYDLRAGTGGAFPFLLRRLTQFCLVGDPFNKLLGDEVPCTWR